MLVGQVLALALHPQAALVACAKTAAFAACIAVPAIALRNTHAVHPHHYAGALLLLPVASAAGRFSCVSVVVEGLVWGLLVEGAATWGMDPLLVPHVVPAGAATDYPTTVWVSVVSSFARPRANAAVALALLELLSPLAPLCDSLMKHAGDKAGDGGDGEVGGLFRVLSFGEPADVLVRQLTGAADGGLRVAQPATFASSTTLRSAISATGLEATVGSQYGVWLSELEALRAQLRALLAGSSAAAGWSSPSARVAAFVLLSSVYGALRAGAVEIRQSIALQAATRPAEDGAEGALHVLAALCSGAELLPSRRAFDTEHVRWRGARDACEELCVNAPGACGAASAACVGAKSAELSLLLRELQQEVTRLVDVASRM